MSKTLTLKPRMSEKTYASSLATNTFVFIVPKSVNKIQIAASVAEQFSVGVVNVRTAVVKGKKARSIRLGKYRNRIAFFECYKGFLIVASLTHNVFAVFA